MKTTQSPYLGLALLRDGTGKAPAATRNPAPQGTVAGEAPPSFAGELAQVLSTPVEGSARPSPGSAAARIEAPVSAAEGFSAAPARRTPLADPLAPAAAAREGRSLPGERALNSTAAAAGRRRISEARSSEAPNSPPPKGGEVAGRRSAGEGAAGAALSFVGGTRGFTENSPHLLARAAYAQPQAGSSAPARADRRADLPRILPAVVDGPLVRQPSPKARAQQPSAHPVATTASPAHAPASASGAPGRIRLPSGAAVEVTGRTAPAPLLTAPVLSSASVGADRAPPASTHPASSRAAARSTRPSRETEPRADEIGAPDAPGAAPSDGAMSTTPASTRSHRSAGNAARSPTPTPTPTATPTVRPRSETGGVRSAGRPSAPRVSPRDEDEPVSRALGGDVSTDPGVQAQPSEKAPPALRLEIVEKGIGTRITADKGDKTDKSDSTVKPGRAEPTEPIAQGPRAAAGPHRPGFLEPSAHPSRVAAHRTAIVGNAAPARPPADKAMRATEAGATARAAAPGSDPAARAPGPHAPQVSPLSPFDSSLASSLSPSAPLPAAPSALLAHVAEDLSLRATIMPERAVLTVDTGAAGELALHLRVKDGVTDVRVSGAAAETLEMKSSELRTALASEGLTLGSFESGQSPQGEPGVERPDDLPESASPLHSNPVSIPPANDLSPTSTSAAARGLHVTA